MGTWWQTQEGKRQSRQWRKWKRTSFEIYNCAPYPHPTPVWGKGENKAKTRGLVKSLLKNSYPIHRYKTRSPGWWFHPRAHLHPECLRLQAAYTCTSQRWKVRLKNNLLDKQLDELSQKNMMSTLKDRDQNKQINGKVTSVEIKVTKAGRRNFQNITKAITNKIKNTAPMKKRTECYFKKWASGNKTELSSLLCKHSR